MGSFLCYFGTLEFCVAKKGEKEGEGGGGERGRRREEGRMMRGKEERADAICP